MAVKRVVKPVEQKSTKGQLQILSPDPTLPKGYLSVSAVKMFLKCPRQFEYRYIHNKVVPPGVALIEGSAHHAALEHDNKERIRSGKQAPFSDLVSLFSEKFSQDSKTVEDWEGDSEKAVLARGHDLLHRWHASSGWLSPVGAEEKFEKTIGGVPVLGFIDVTTETQVWDFKVVGKAKTEVDALNDLQLHTYSLVTGKKKVGFVSLVKNATKPESKVQRVAVEASPSDTANVSAIFSSVAHAIRLGSFPHTDPSNWWCSPRFCGYYRECKGVRCEKS